MIMIINLKLKKKLFVNILKYKFFLIFFVTKNILLFFCIKLRKI